MNIAASLIVGFVIVMVTEPFLIPFLHKLKFGQSILEDGPTWHAKKQGTPTMGGLAFLLATAVATLLFARDREGIAVLVCALLFGAIGFVDDYLKVVKKQNQGFNAIQKFTAQTLVSAAYAFYVYFILQPPGVRVPFTDLTIGLGVFYVPFIMLVLLATTNSVNLTDGLDGLAASVTTVAALFFTIACNVCGAASAAAVLAAVVGGCIGFLFFNHYPAKVFMGDTGSLFLGGALAAAAISAGLELYLLIAGFVFLAESLSDIIQVAVYKRTKKRVFKMAPIHHHFEMCGWKETKIVNVFSAVTLLLCVLCWFAL